MAPTPTQATETAAAAPVTTETATTTAGTAPQTASPDKESRRKIVIALDNSEHSKLALAWTLDNLLNTNTDHLYLLSVGIFTDRIGDLWAAVAGPYVGEFNRAEVLERRAEEYANQILKEAAQVINEHSEKLTRNAKISHEIYALKGGDPREVIVDFCEEKGADILVMGSRGLGMVSKTLIGSVSDYCVSHAPCPTIVVRGSQEANEGK
ncbi:hypothetical protein HK102_010420 [Quaeritorhiza haematococci]|nr:hypothetical protein HK102_010420 [Quaeritorhiza haematococci]